MRVCMYVRRCASVRMGAKLRTSQMGANLRPNARECVSGVSHPGRAVHLEEARRKIENAANLGIARKRASVVKLQSEKSALMT